MNKNLRPLFPNDRKSKKLHISKYAYITKRFQGFVFSLDFDNAQISSFRNLIFSFEFKFLFIGFWINIEIY